MTELMHNPEAMRKAKKEIAETIGVGKPVEESDVARLPYLQSVIKESLRMHPPAPLLLPRRAKTDVQVCGYTVPQGTQILINEWAIGRNPAIWEVAHRFSPERFLDSDIDVKGRHFKLTPFGSGRRICPGSPLAVRMLHNMLGSLITMRLKIVSMFSSLKCKHALVKRQNFQLIRATYAFWMKNNASIGEGEYADEIFS